MWLQHLWRNLKVTEVLFNPRQTYTQNCPQRTLGMHGSLQITLWMQICCQYYIFPSYFSNSSKEISIWCKIWVETCSSDWNIVLFSWMSVEPLQRGTSLGNTSSFYWSGAISSLKVYALHELLTAHTKVLQSSLSIIADEFCWPWYPLCQQIIPLKLIVIHEPRIPGLI